MYREWWEGLDLPGQKVAAAQLAILTDSQLKSQFEAVGEMSGWTTKQVASWVRSQPNRRLAAELAIVAERQRIPARPGLIRELEEIR